MVIATRRPVTADSAAAVQFGPQGPGAQQPESVSALSRIAVVGDSDFATNSFFHIMGNGRLFLNTVNYLAARENLVGIEPRTRDLPRVNLTNRQVKGTFFLSVILIPALLAFIGVRRVVEAAVTAAESGRDCGRVARAGGADRVGRRH
jgi:ABC-type uncharacterized transport system involved in gliding motility auxiliary subunit